jgi:four helix bundle protein
MTESIDCDEDHRLNCPMKLAFHCSAFSQARGYAAMKNFRDLQVWEKAHSLTLASYRITKEFPKQEMYGMSSQIRRCAASIPANIAEGCGKRGNGEFQRYLNIATGSASELEYHFLLAHDLNFISDPNYNELNDRIIEVKRMLASLARKVEADRLEG